MRWFLLPLLLLGSCELLLPPAAAAGQTLLDSAVSPGFAVEDPIDSVFQMLGYAVPGLAPLLLLFRGVRKKLGHGVRGVLGNSAPRRWVEENYEDIASIRTEVVSLRNAIEELKQRASSSL